MNPGYYVETYDFDLEEYTPQLGVPHGPYRLFQLRTALRKLRDLGYQADRQDFNIYVFRLEDQK